MTTEYAEEEVALVQLRSEHRDLDTVISFLLERQHPDPDLAQRLKIRKLNLRDRISRLENVLAAAGGS